MLRNSFLCLDLFVTGISPTIEGKSRFGVHSSMPMSMGKSRNCMMCTMLGKAFFTRKGDRELVAGLYRDFVAKLAKNS